MASDILQIGKSGALAARSALEVTAQNIANASDPDYARRSLSLSEVVGTGSVRFYSDSAYGGTRVDRVLRSDSTFLQQQARLSASDLARSEAELAGITQAEAAIEQSGIFPAIVEFEATLAQLQADPLSSALRAAVLEAGRTLAGTIQLGDQGIERSADQISFAAAAHVESINLAAGELARINAAIVRSQPGTAGYAALLDRRDAQLSQLAERSAIAVEYGIDGTAAVRLGGAGGPYLVNGTTLDALTLAQSGDGTISFALSGGPVDPVAGSLAGQMQALVTLRDTGLELDALAAQIIGTVNAAQAGGTAPDGSIGQPFFAGTGAADIAAALTSGAGIATAPAGAPAGSRDGGNLTALRDALANNGPAAEADRMLFALANAVSGRTIARDTLQVIAANAQIALAAETGVDLDAEAANLVRFQQAFQASGRVMQVASDIFDTVLAIR